MNIELDFETYSTTPIEAGGMKYSKDPEADIVCLYYKIDEQPTVGWQPGMAVPEEFYSPDAAFWAHGAGFDKLIWANIAVPKYSFPEAPLERWRDSMALANRYTLPSKLAEAGLVLKLEIQKNPIGKALIQKICIPTKAGNRPKAGVDYTPSEFAEFCEYCRTDVEAMHLLIQALPSSALSAKEQRCWELTQKMNEIGLPIDEQAPSRILGYIQSYVEEMTLRVPQITNGQVSKVTQGKRMLDWLASQGVVLRNMQAPTVEKALKRDDLPEEARELLELRQALGRSSTAKYIKLELMVHDGRVHGNLQYYGAMGTGRWAGRGFQLQNLPRASVPNPEEMIEKFITFQPVMDPVKVAMALIRPMICAKPGKSLIVSDYSSIENRLLVWYAGDQKALDDFSMGVDQYRNMAAFLFQVPVDKVTKDQRLIGKIIILGCGYVMGATRFQQTALDWGVKLSLHEAQAAVDAYRALFPLVVRMWYALKRSMMSAIRSPGTLQETRGVTFRVVMDRNRNVWLAMTLRSGRVLYYKDPHISEGKYGENPAHWGVDPYTKKWSPLELSPGRITENIMQATARDVMAQGVDNVDIYMPEVDLLGTVHDEAIGEIDECNINENTLARFNQQLCNMPSWADGLPLEAEGYIEKRYRK